MLVALELKPHRGNETVALWASQQWKIVIWEEVTRILPQTETLVFDSGIIELLLSSSCSTRMLLLEIQPRSGRFSPIGWGGGGGEEMCGSKKRFGALKKGCGLSKSLFDRRRLSIFGRA